MQHIVIASLFFKEIPIQVHMLITWVNPLEIASSLILKDTLFDHGIVRPLSLRRWPDRERTPLLHIRATSSYRVKLLLENLRQESPLDDASTFQILIVLMVLCSCSILQTSTEAHRVCSRSLSRFACLPRVLSRLILDCLLHLVVLEAYQCE